MEEKEPYKLPEGWKWVKLGEVAEKVQYGYTEKATNEKIGPKFLRITDIQDNFVVLEYYPFSRKRVGIGTFLLEVREGGKKLVGHATFVSEGAMNIVTMQDITLDRVSEN